LAIQTAEHSDDEQQQGKQKEEERPARPSIDRRKEEEEEAEAGRTPLVYPACLATQGCTAERGGTGSPTRDAPILRRRRRRRRRRASAAPSPPRQRPERCPGAAAVPRSIPAAVRSLSPSASVRGVVGTSLVPVVLSSNPPASHPAAFVLVQETTTALATLPFTFCCSCSSGPARRCC
jgi:hypothetical protein